MATAESSAPDSNGEFRVSFPEVTDQENIRSQIQTTNNVEVVLIMEHGSEVARLPQSSLIQANSFQAYLSSILQDVTENNSENICPVCLEPFLVGQKVPIITCKHQIHEACAAMWIKHCIAHSKPAKCPICNEILFAPVMYNEPYTETREQRILMMHAIMLRKTCMFFFVRTVTSTVFALIIYFSTIF